MHPLSPFTSTNLVILFHVVPSRNWFRSTLKTIKSIYKFISIEDIESYYYDGKTYDNCCHICFDDGDRTFYENAFPVLKEMNVPTTLFVSPRIISRENNYWFQEIEYINNHIDDVLLKATVCEVLNCNYSLVEKYSILSILKCMQLKRILQVIEIIKERYNIHINERCNITKDQLFELNNSDLVTIGAHTMNHPILSNETNGNAEKEILESVEDLSMMIDRDIKYFAYPNGTIGLDFSTREQTILQEKIKLAFTLDAGFFNKNSNPLGIPRIDFLGSERENSVWILSKLLLVPILDRINKIIRRKTETKERKEIKKWM